MELLNLFLSIPAAWLALIGALLGGTGLKLIEHYLSRPSRDAKTAAELRAELRQDLSNIRAELKSCQAESDKYQDRYWALVEENAQLKAAAALHGYKVDKVVEVVKEEHPGRLEDLNDVPD